MKYRCRVFFTDKQKSEIWDRWQRGESMSSIGRGFDRGSSSIYSLLARTGGIRPPERIRSRLAMTLTDREEISRGLPERVNDFEIVAFGLQAQVSLRSIARSLKRSTSTISREVRRDGGVKNIVRQHQIRRRVTALTGPNPVSRQAMPLFTPRQRSLFTLRLTDGVAKAIASGKRSRCGDRGDDY
jgi:hypothetical protein